MVHAFWRLFRDESGQGLVEYGIILALIAVIVIVAVRQLGTGTNKLYTNSANAMNGIGQ